MDFVDWRKSTEKVTADENVGEKKPDPGRLRGKRFYDYIDEIIHEAEKRGEFANLEGTGQPLHLDEDQYAGENAMAYRMLKSNGFAPPEIELAKEIRKEREQAEKKLTKLVHQQRTLRNRRIPPFASEKRAFNLALEKALTEYEKTLRELNRKTLTLNLTTPSAMHRPMLEVERLVQQFRESCQPFDV
jgi:DnaJ family protein C protein 28